MRLSVGAGIGPFRVSQTLARTGGRRRPSARQTIAVESVKLAGQAAMLPVTLSKACDSRDQKAFDRDMRIAWKQFNSGQWCLSKAILAVLFGSRWFLTSAATDSQPSDTPAR